MYCFPCSAVFYSGFQVTRAWSFVMTHWSFPPMLIAKFKGIRSNNIKLLSDLGVLCPVAPEGDKLATSLLGVMPE